MNAVLHRRLLNRRRFNGSLAALTTGAASCAPAAAETVPFTLSVMLWTVAPDHPMDYRLRLISRAGYRFVELSGEQKTWSAAEFALVRSVSRRLGLAFDAASGVDSGFADPAGGDLFLAQLGGMIEVAKLLECPAIIVLSGKKISGLAPAAQHQAAIDVLSRASEMAARNNVLLLVECLDPEEDANHYLTRASEGLEIVRRVNHPNLKFLYDIYHEQISEGDLIEKLVRNLDIVRVVHVADVPGRHEPGTGEINYGNIFATLRAHRFSGTVAMEFVPRADPLRALQSARELAVHGA